MSLLVPFLTSSSDCEIMNDTLQNSAIQDGDAHKFINSFNQISEVAYDISEKHGFWETPDDYQKICLMFTELSEIVEAFRIGNPPSKKIPEYSLVEEEMADAIIRIMDFAGRKKIDLGGAIMAKMKYNQSRPYKYKKF